MEHREIMNEWYTFSLLPTGKVCIASRNATPAKMQCVDREECEETVRYHRFNPFLKALYSRALEEFDRKESDNDTESQNAILHIDVTRFADM